METRSDIPSDLRAATAALVVRDFRLCDLLMVLVLRRIMRLLCRIEDLYNLWRAGALPNLPPPSDRVANRTPAPSRAMHSPAAPVITRRTCRSALSWPNAAAPSRAPAVIGHDALPTMAPAPTQAIPPDLPGHPRACGVVRIVPEDGFSKHRGDHSFFTRLIDLKFARHECYDIKIISFRRPTMPLQYARNPPSTGIVTPVM